MTTKKNIQFDSISPKTIGGFIDLFDGGDLREYLLVKDSRGWTIEFADTGKKQFLGSLDDAVSFLDTVEREAY